jgi:hypothetical protein
MRIDLNNDMVQVMKLQAFLIHFEGHTNVQITGIFDQATLQAVNAFQLKYKADILNPLGLSQPTGYVHARTLAKINQIVCGTSMPQAPVKVVPPVKKVAPKPCPCPCECPPCSTSKEGSKEGSATTTAAIEIIGDASPDKGQNKSNLAAALFALPDNLADFMNVLYGLILILVVLYVLGTVLENVLYKNTPENVRKRFLAKWITISAGLVVALIGVYMTERYYLILPLLIVLVATVGWLLTYAKHNSLRSSAKSWHMVLAARAKTIWNKAKEEGKNTSVTTETVVVEKK